MARQFLRKAFASVAASVFFGSLVSAQDEFLAANTVFTEAMSIYSNASSLEEEDRLEAYENVLRLLDLIVEAYPNSLPGQRIIAGGSLGGLNLEELRALVADATKEPLSIENSDPVEATPNETKISRTEETIQLRWFQRILPTATEAPKLGHGDFPSFGQRTHAGVDLVSACNQDVRTVLGGTVELIVRPGDKSYPTTGGSLVIRHDGTASKPTFSAFFGLSRVSGEIGMRLEPGQLIGQTGKIHDSEMCGVHFELRHFDTHNGPFFPLWNSLFGVGNWSEDDDFIVNWENPSQFLLGADDPRRIIVWNGSLLARNGNVGVASSGLLGRFDNSKPLFFNRDISNQRFIFNGALDLVRGYETVDVILRYLTVRKNPSTTEVASWNTDHDFDLLVELYSNQDLLEPIFIVREPSGLSYNERTSSMRRPTEPPTVSLPKSVLLEADMLRVYMVSNREIPYQSIAEIDLVSLAAGEGKSVAPDKYHEIGARLVAALNHCTEWEEEAGKSLVFPIFATEELEVSRPSSNWLEAQNISYFRADDIRNKVYADLDKCTEVGLVPYVAGKTWSSFEVTLGDPNNE